MLSALMGVLLASAQGGTITLDSPGLTVSAFCAELTRQTGRRYEARDEIERDLLAVHLDKAPATDVVQRLCKVERARLEFDGQVTVLRPDRAARAKLAHERFTIRVRRVEALQAVARAFERKAPLTAAEVKATERKFAAFYQLRLRATSPGASVRALFAGQREDMRAGAGQALAVILAGIAPEQLAALPDGGTGVWSTYPTKLEHRVPVNGNALINRYEDDVRTWLTATGHASPGEGTANREPTALIQLSVQVIAHGVLDAVVAGFDKEGKRTCEGFQFLDDRYVDASNHEPMKATNQQVERVTVAPATAKVIRAWVSYPAKTETTTWRSDTSFAAVYFHPEKFDPLAETFGRAIVALAKARGEQLLASEADPFITILPDHCVAGDLLDIGAVERRLTHPRDPEYSVAEWCGSGEWMLVRPQDLDECAEATFDRARLGALLRAAREHHSIGVMDLARYSAGYTETAGPASVRALSALAGMVPDITGLNIAGYGQWPVLSFLGNLDEAELAVAEGQDGLPLATCKPAELKPLWRALQLSRLSYHGARDVWRSGRTDGLPDGLPGGGLLHIRVAENMAVLAGIGEPGKGVDMRYFTPTQLARRLYRQAGDEIEPSYNLTSVQPEVDSTYTLAIEFPDQTSAAFSLHSYAPASKAVGSLDSLPAAYRLQVESAIHAAKARAVTSPPKP